MMMRPGGYAVITMPDDMKETVVNFDGTRREIVKNNHGKYEADTFSCFHCGAVEHVPHKPDVNEVGFCRSCISRSCSRHWRERRYLCLRRCCIVGTAAIRAS